MTTPTHPAPPVIRPMPAGHVLVVMIVALLGGALLNAQALLRTAERQELGTGRSVALAFAEPLASVSGFLRIDTPRDAVDSALGRGVPRRDVTTVAPTTTTTRPSQDAVPSTTTTTLPALKAVTADDPLDLLIIGDSFAELFGPALVNRSTDTGVIDATVDFRFISGLSRPDYFDWPSYLAGELPEVQPDAAVVIFGGNDAQDVAVGGEHFELGTDAWIDLYAIRVAELMDTMLESVDRVYWVGLPIMESDSFTANAVMMNSVYESEAAERPRVTYISSFDLFKDEQGQYNAYLDGRHMRYGDGAHFTWNGGYRLADAVLPVIAIQWDFEIG
ncbi:MAG: SGNH/GDSL hydrolase family protein [Acidimicrobiia bacterium]